MSGKYFEIMGSGSSVGNSDSGFLREQDVEINISESNNIEKVMIFSPIQCSDVNDIAHNLEKIDIYFGDRNIFGYKHGNGSLEYSNGDIYTGGWVNNKKDGRGFGGLIYSKYCLIGLDYHRKVFIR